MKNRILSMVLIVAMVVAMIPVAVVTAFAADYTGYSDGYDIYYSTIDPTLDGKMDAVYDNSEVISGISTVRTGCEGFTAYAIITAKGYYVYAEINDSSVDVSAETSAGAGDKFQVYLQVSDGTNYNGGYYDMDYAFAATAQGKGTVKTTIIPGGYTVEFFLPWSTYSNIGTMSSSNAKVWLGLQVNDGKTNGCLTDNPSTSGYWTGYISTSPTKFMNPTNIVTTGKATTVDAETLKYTSFVTTENITLDGKRDDVYLNAQPITQGHVSKGSVGKDTGFTTYIVAKDTGLYIFASMYDDTLDKATAAAGGLRNQDGDKFQLYLQLGNGVWSRWGYIDFDYVNGGRNWVTPKSANGFDNTNKSGYSSDKIQQKAVFWDDNKGWDIEIFIPNEFCQDVRGSKVTSATLKNLLCKVNVQQTNMTCHAWDANGTQTQNTYYGLSYDVAGASESWSNTNNYVLVDFSVSPVSVPGSGALTYAPSITIDGVKDAAYGDDSTAFIIDRERGDNFTANNGNAYVKAWITVTNTHVNLYALVNDTTIAASSPSDAVRFYVYFPMTGTTTYYGYGYARDGHIDTTSRWKSEAYLHTNNNDDTWIGESGARKDLGNGLYSVEMAMYLPNIERNYLAQGGTLDLGIVIAHLDKGTDGTDHWNRSAYEYSWGSSYDKSTFPRYEVNYTHTAANMAVKGAITGANVALGDSIAMNYYATIPTTVANPYLKVTMNGTSTLVKGVATGLFNQYKFTFDGIAPQCMADAIDAELYIDGKATGIKKIGYSVVQNLNAVKNADNAALIYALANYGAAAQKYSYYKTEAPVTGMINGYAAPSYSTIVNNDRTTGTPISETVKLTALGVYFSGTNRIYAKFQADTLDDVSVYINGTKAQIQATKDAGIYVVYSEDIKVLDFDVKYTIEIVKVKDKDEVRQTATYSVNAYAAAKQTNADYAYTKDLVKALYAYGVAAEAFVK